MTVYAYNGWPVIEKPTKGQLTPLVVRGEAFAPGVLAGDVHTVLEDLVGFLDREVEPVVMPEWHAADDWGYSYRANRNDARYVSTHATGGAIDYNATRHPNGVRGTWAPWQLAKVRAFLRDWLEGVVQWGEDYVGGVVDGMHFEIIKPARDVARVAAKIRAARVAAAAPPPPPPPPPAPPPPPPPFLIGDDTMILACELEPGKVAYGIYSGGILTGLSNAGGADRAAREGRLYVQWVTAEDWRHLDAKSQQLLTR